MHKHPDARHAETSCTSKICKVDENGAGVENLSKGTTLTSGGIPQNIHNGLQNVTVFEKITSKGSTVKDTPLAMKTTRWLKKPAPKEEELTLEETDMMCAIERADEDLTDLKESLELFNKNCSILCS